jgi:hypothetical protein
MACVALLFTGVEVDPLMLQLASTQTHFPTAALADIHDELATLT